MGYNIYKQIPKIKEQTKNFGYEKDIPINIFLKSVMILFGMKRKTAEKWFHYFIENGIINVSDDELINFI